MTNPTPLSLESYLKGLERRKPDLNAIIDTKGLPSNFKPTTAFRLIVDRLTYAREVKAALALVTGAHGAGKTTALKYYAHHQDVLSWECTPSYNAKYLLLDIARRLGINAGVSWNVQTSVVAEQLAIDPRTFLLDEAQRLNYEGMDLLKYLADQSGSTFVLSASPSLETRIDRWPDISSRCTVRVRVAPPSAEEFVELYQVDGFKVESLLELHRISNGVMRVLQAILREIDIHLAAYNADSKDEKKRGDLHPAHIHLIADRVIG